MQLATMAYSIKILAQLVREMGALKMTEMKLQDMKMADQIAGHENARHEIDGPSCRARNCRVVCPTKIRKV